MFHNDILNITQRHCDDKLLTFMDVVLETSQQEMSSLNVSNAEPAVRPSIFFTAEVSKHLTDVPSLTDFNTFLWMVSSFTKILVMHVSSHDWTNFNRIMKITLLKKKLL